MKKSIYLFLVFGLILSFNIEAQQKKYTLVECVQIALEKNISIKQAVIDYENSRIEKEQAIGNFFPSLNARGSHFWNNGLNQNITTGLLENTTTQFTSIGANVGVSLYNGLQNLNRFHRANLSMLANEYQLQDMKDDISLFVANAYLQVFFNKELLAIQQLQLKVSKEELARAEKLVKAGVFVKANLYELESAVASQEQLIVQAENDYRLAKINLLQLLLIDEYDTFEIADLEYDIPESDILERTPRSIFLKSLTIRNDIKALETNVQISKKDIEIAKGNLQPNLSFFYGYSTRISYADRRVQNIDKLREVTLGVVDVPQLGLENVEITQEVPTSEILPPLPFFEQFTLNDGHNFGFQLDIPILNNFSAKNNIKRNQINLLRSQNALEQQKITLENDINQAYNATLGAYKLYLASKKTLQARERTYKDASNRYEAGVMNAFDFVQTKQRFEASESDVLRAKYDYILRLKVLEFYFGVPINL